VPVCTIEEMRTKVKLSELQRRNPELLSTHSLQDTSTALLAGILTQIEKQLKLIPFFLSDFKLKHEITYTAYKCITGRKHS
jgi:hypothetical protein